MGDIIQHKKAVAGTDYPAKDSAMIDILQRSSSLAEVPFGYDPATTLNLTLGYFGGPMLIDGVLTAIAAGTIVLTASQTNYVEATRAGAVSANLVGFTAGQVPLYTAVTAVNSITTLTDKRPGWVNAGSVQMAQKLVLSVAGGAGTTILTADQQRCDIYEFTGALTGNRILEFATNVPKNSFVVYNNTTGAFTLTLRDTGGAGVAITQGARRVCYHDGADIVLAEQGGLQTSDTDLDAIAALATTGLIVRTGTGTATTRTIGIGTANGLSWANGDGVAGAPALSMAASSETVVGTIEIATAAEVLTGTDNTRAVTPAGAAGAMMYQGKFSWPIPAWGLRPAANNGCAPLAQVAMGGTQPDIFSLDFDATTQEFADFFIPMPKSWNEGTVTFRAKWSHPATATNFGVVWGLYAVAIGDGENVAVAYGTAAEVADTGGNTSYEYRTAESAAITIAGSPQAEDTVWFRIYRKPSDGSDTLAVDARLHAIELFLTVNGPNDA